MKQLRMSFLLLSMFFYISSCTKKVVLERYNSSQNIPTAPNYANPDHWAALPTKADAADRIPLNCIEKDNQAEAKADVFFVHPTIYTYKPAEGAFPWNGDVNDAVLNQKTDESTILNQASVFNGSCKIYAPRYRQAHFYAFRTPNKEDKETALNLAYQDVRTAFEYYLKNYNNNRPIVIASHSQGTIHATRLLKEYFDGKPLQKQLVFAYIIGIITQPTEFKDIKVANSSDEVGGVASWNTFATGYFPTYYGDIYRTGICTNPLTWKTDTTFAPKEFNRGAVIPNFKMKPQLIDAQIHGGMLWINKPYTAGRFLIRTKIWHIADINFFWQNMRDNVALRVRTFLK